MHPFEGIFFLSSLTFELNASVNVNHFELLNVIRLIGM